MLVSIGRHGVVLCRDTVDAAGFEARGSSGVVG